jgi:hypothetical protein
VTYTFTDAVGALKASLNAIVGGAVAWQVSTNGNVVQVSIPSGPAGDASLLALDSDGGIRQLYLSTF